MRVLWAVLLIGSGVTIFFVLVNGANSQYRLLDSTVLPGSMIVLASLATLFGSFSMLFSRVGTVETTPAGLAVRRRPRSRLLGATFLAVALFILITGGRIPGGELAVGDCFDIPEGDEVVAVPTKPCDEAHDAEVYLVRNISDSAGSDYPGSDSLHGTAVATCLEGFEGYVGAPFESSTLDAVWLIPQPSGWAQGERSITCAAYRVDGNKLFGSVRGSGR